MAHEEQPNLVEIIVTPANEVTVVEQRNIVEVHEDSPTEVLVSTLGLQGPLGPTGPTGPPGPPGQSITGPAGPGLATGGSAKTLLQKRSGSDYDTEWTTTPTVTALRVGQSTASFETTLITASTEDTDEITLDVVSGDSVKYTVRATNGIHAMTTEIVATALGEVVNYTEYGTVVVGVAPCSFDVVVDSGEISLICTPATDTLTEYRVVRHAIAG